MERTPFFFCFLDWSIISSSLLLQALSAALARVRQWRPQKEIAGGGDKCTSGALEMR